MLRNAWFQVHWFIGITAGIVLAVVGFTGGLLSFQHELERLLNPGVMTVTPGSVPALEPDALLARLQAEAPDRRIQAIALSADPADAVRVTFAPINPEQRRGENRFADPYTGELLGPVQGETFFRTVRELHRWLLADDLGKQIVGASTLTLLVLCATGLYLRWPRRVRDWRVWLLFNPRKQGRSFLWDLHSVLGTWVLPFYLLAAMTGLYWSYDWYRDGLHALSGVPRQERPAATQQPTGGGDAVRGAREAQGGAAEQRSALPAPSLATAWERFNRTVPGYSSVTLRLPSRPGQAVEFTYQDPDPPHERANNRIAFDVATGEVQQHERYADKPLNAQMMGSMLPLHSGEFFGVTAQALMMLASFAMPVFAVTGWMLYLDRRRKKRSKRAAMGASAGLRKSLSTPAQAVSATYDWLIAFASQSGVAERFAWQAAGAVQAAGAPVRICALDELDRNALARYRRALFVVSTFGDGEPPDNARGFARRTMRESLPLTDMSYGLLALGDRNYAEFCGFGRALDSWLQAQGAQMLFASVEMDRNDAGALNDWRRQIADLFGGALDDAAGFVHWGLAERRLLNPGSAGQPTYHIELLPLDAAQHWQAGDIAEVRVPTGAGEVVREYSIASLTTDGSLHLLVRQARRDNGALGLGSAFLTEQLQVGDELELRIRTNRNFHAPADDRPMLLIGNGTGMASLRVHLKARSAAGRHRNWLVFGERNAHCDFYYAEEIERWSEAGVIERIDTAFSRDQSPRVYVQDRLRAAADDVCRWVDQGAVIYVCGSLNGMAEGVDAALGEILGRERVVMLQECGRYRKDVY